MLGKLSLLPVFCILCSPLAMSGPQAKTWSGNVLTRPVTGDPRLQGRVVPDESEERELLGPNFELKEVLSLRIWEMFLRTEAFPETTDLKRCPIEFHVYLAVGKDGLMNIGVRPARYLLKNGSHVYVPGRLLKVTKEGRLAGILGGLRGPILESLYEPLDWNKYRQRLKGSREGFCSMTRLLTDKTGTVYICHYTDVDGCISVCAPGSHDAQVLDLTLEAGRVVGAYYNKSTGGVVIEGCKANEEPRCMVELFEGKVARKGLPKQYLRKWEDERILELHSDRALIWRVLVEASDDMQTILSCRMDVQAIISLDFGILTQSVDFIGESSHGLVFNVRFSGDQWPNRAVVFWPGGLDYGGHLVAPKNVVKTQEHIGVDGQYYEFGMDDSTGTLHVFKAVPKYGLGEESRNRLEGR